MEIHKDFDTYLLSYFKSIGHNNAALIQFSSKYDYVIILSYFNSNKLNWWCEPLSTNKWDHYLKGFLEIFRVKAIEFGLQEKSYKLLFYVNDAGRNVKVDFDLKTGEWEKSIISGKKLH